MYRKVEDAPRQAEDFELPFEGKLSQDNRWGIMAKLVPWDEFEEEYAKNFARDMGAPADINYPNDLGLLNQVRVKTEKIIDILYNLIKRKSIVNSNGCMKIKPRELRTE